VTPGGAGDTRLDARQTAAREGCTPRHLSRLPGFPSPHYVAGMKRWWLSEIVAWEEANTTASAPAALRRGVANLRRGTSEVRS
jgi:hypothetical protein